MNISNNNDHPQNNCEAIVPYSKVQIENVVVNNIQFMNNKFGLKFPALMGKDSPLFKPIPWLPLDDYRQKNRFYRTREEIVQLCIDEVGFNAVDPSSVRLLLCPYQNMSPLKLPGGIREDDHLVCKVLKIGDMAFSSEKFVAGPPCTYGDYVLISGYSVKTSKCLSGLTFYMVEDVGILGNVPDPQEYYNYNLTRRVDKI